MLHLLCVWLLALGSWACFIFNLDLYLWVECWTSRLSRCLLSVTVSESSVGLGPLPVCGCLACMWTMMYGYDLCAMWLLPHCLWTDELWCTVCGCFILILCCFHSFIRICFNAWLQLLRRANCFKWLHVYRCFRFVLSIPDRNRHVPDRSIPFPISRNIKFVFPSGFPVPATVPSHIMQEREWLRCFPDRSRPFSTLVLAAWFGILVTETICILCNSRPI